MTLAGYARRIRASTTDNRPAQGVQANRAVVVDIDTLGRRLAFARKRAGLTQIQASVAAGITQGSLSPLENDETKEPRASTVSRLAAVYGVPAEWLLTGIESSTSDDLDAVATKPKRKSKKTSPTQRSLQLMRERGCVAEVTERWNAFARVRHDLLGFVDVLALSPEGETIAIQTTSGSNVAARVDKITNECATALAFARRCGWRVVVHGWRRLADGKWHAREVDIS